MIFRARKQAFFQSFIVHVSAWWSFRFTNLFKFLNPAFIWAIDSQWPYCPVKSDFLSISNVFAYLFPSLTLKFLWNIVSLSKEMFNLLDSYPYASRTMKCNKWLFLCALIWLEISSLVHSSDPSESFHLNELKYEFHIIPPIN